jgi:hypothetical protein
MKSSWARARMRLRSSEGAWGKLPPVPHQTDRTLRCRQACLLRKPRTTRRRRPSCGTFRQIKSDCEETPAGSIPFFSSSWLVPPCSSPRSSGPWFHPKGPREVSAGPHRTQEPGEPEPQPSCESGTRWMTRRSRSRKCVCIDLEILSWAQSPKDH